MPRDLPLSNGSLLITFDLNYAIRDIYYPRVGAFNHAALCRSRTGVWVAGDFAWLDSDEWHKEMVYATDSLVSRVTAYNKRLQLRLTMHDAVDIGHDVFLRQAEVESLAEEEREVRLFFHYEFRLAEYGVGDTIYYHPELKSLIAYKARTYFLLNGMAGDVVGIDDWTVGSRGPDGGSGSCADAEDGELTHRSLAWGLVDGVVALHLGPVAPTQPATAFHWMVVGNRFHEVQEGDLEVRQRHPQTFIERTREYWRLWVNKEPTDFGNLPPWAIDLYRRSLLIIRSQIDDGGAITAGNDTDVLENWRDTYSYVWPRDGSYVALALDKAGYPEVTRRFFEFCASVITSEGYFLHKYTPDGALASSWMAWADNEGNPQLPIQEDETGLVLHALWEHYARYRDLEFIAPFYSRLIKAAGDFLASYREPTTGLPAPSYDLWEEHRGIHSYTVATVWAGLRAASRFAAMFGEAEASIRYHQAADEIKRAALVYLYDDQRGCFLKMIDIGPNGRWHRDTTIESSLAALFTTGMFSADDPKIVATMAAIKERLRCPTPVGGLARYENDVWRRISQGDQEMPGNPWCISTLWLASYYIARAKEPAHLEPALDLIRWVNERSLPSGVLGEQFNPYTGEPINVSPLTWSHAAYVSVIRDYLAKLAQLQT